MDTTIRFSVVVSSADGRFLKNCIEAIQKLAYPSSLFEIVLILTRDSARLNSALFENKRVKAYIYDGNLSEARNFGIRVSTGEILAFTDDDCEADSKWLASLDRAMNDPAIACAGGSVLAEDRPRDTHTMEVRERSLTYPANPWSIQGANMAIRSSTFEKTGVFDDTLGAGSPNLTAEDTDMIYRILKCGYRIIVQPAAVVYHKARRTPRDYAFVGWRWGIGAAVFVRKHFADPYMKKVMMRCLFVDPMKILFRGFKNCSLKDLGSALLFTCAFLSKLLIQGGYATEGRRSKHSAS